MSMLAAWNVLKSEYLFRRPWLTVRREELELPNGNRIPEFYVLEYPEWVNVIAMTEAGEFVLVRQYRHGLGRISLELPAGVCEKTDLSPLEGARRELAEETGYGGGDWREYMVLSANPSTQNNLTHTFLALGVRKVEEPHLDAGEALTVELYSEAELFELLKEGQMIQSLMAALLWKYLFEHQSENSERPEKS
ncbi:MAG: NUDIX hydrolase [Victivallaceae bacterium]|nr:NUDIX hydrolase [Victivallaceae bacterium]